MLKWGLILHICGLLLWAGVFRLSGAEFELQGYMEVAKEVSVSPQVVRGLQALAAQLQPNEPSPRITKAVIEAYEQQHRTRVFGNATFTPQPESMRQFTIYVRGPAWLVKSYAPETQQKALRETGSSGDGQVFSSLLSVGNSSQGIVHLRPLVPHSMRDEGVSILWMFCKGGDYLNALTNQLVWPMHINHVRGDDPVLDLREQAHWELEPFRNNRWVKRLEFFGSPSWTNAYYEVIRWTNSGGYMWPQEFYAEMRSQPRLTREGFEQHSVRRWMFTVTNAMPNCTRRDLTPTVYPKMSVFDTRVKQPEAYANNTNGVRKGYVLTEKKWEKSVASAQARVDGRPVRVWWHWAGGAVLATGLVLVPVFWQRKKRQKL